MIRCIIVSWQMERVETFLCRGNRGKVKRNINVSPFSVFNIQSQIFQYSWWNINMSPFSVFLTLFSSFIGANGISLSSDGITVFVNDPIDKRITVMTRDKVFLKITHWNTHHPPSCIYWKAHQAKITTPIPGSPGSFPRAASSTCRLQSITSSTMTKVGRSLSVSISIESRLLKWSVFRFCIFVY